ncbi:peptide chain release factor N(5)-glutamine methyltransferase [Halomonas urumqiensis]|uniref:Release factor glutamine methyltransferase n=1 Tax=Halomonas urumqiensis TaxID=1684789 RepID=A0A2N7UG30_9GAMM|nr:peptide chain release factor N(5)-glutamine methyltransferase [Halomonas urumqiensis]PMR79428.1 peptide chain release factor N(5)-glutamine methyltransferase [Halomonas urumqiensis]PTB01450.1 peptide chain release factor N(5)-glutamine methyltransferase [Halomonas urumqiensis]GHE22459.1 release factor glutamine methyltransferase [Halomonas urumqiensis]
MRLDVLVSRAASRLQDAGSPSARLDAEVLMCHVMEVDRTWLYTWGDRLAEPFQRARFEALVAARASGQPVAYLTGEREFWGLGLATDASTLIPRPDTETLVAAAIERAAQPHGRLLDLGTGSGAIALAFASERPGWGVVGVDRAPAAVALAQRNAERLAITNVAFHESDWFAALAGERFQMIVSNPPYIAEHDPHLTMGDVRFEPRSALVAADEGLADLCHLVSESRGHLAAGGWLLLEHGYQQAAAVREALHRAGFGEISSITDLGGHERVSVGRIAG